MMLHCMKQTMARSYCMQGMCGKRPVSQLLLSQELGIKRTVRTWLDPS